MSESQFLFLKTLRPAAGSATTTFLFAPFAFAVAFNAPPTLLAVDFVAILLATGLPLLCAAAVFAGRPPRFGFVTTVVVDVEDISDADVTFEDALVVR